MKSACKGSLETDTILNLFVFWQKIWSLKGNGGALANAVLGSDYVAFERSIQLSSKVAPTADYYQQFLVQSLARAFGPSTTSNWDHYNVVNVPTSEIILSPGANITFNPSAEIDTTVLPENNRVAIIGAAKDMTIKGNLNIKTTDVFDEDYAMVLGAASGSLFRSEYKMENAADYTGNPDVVSITNAGTALGSEKQWHLVNVSISTGGNLVLLVRLQDLNIGTDTAQYNSISVGTGGNDHADSDNIYMYAHNEIKINGLQITGRVDMYMEAVTINLRNVTFPHTSEVTLRSRDGTIGFNQLPTLLLVGLILQM